MAENIPRKMYKVSVDRTKVTRQFFEVEAPADDNSPEFHAVMADCLSGKLKPTSVDSGASEGSLQYAEIDPTLLPADAAATEEVEKEEVPEKIVVVEADQETPDTLVAVLAPGKSLHVCPDSGIPFIGYDGVGPKLPFEHTRSAEERDEMVEKGPWEQDDNVVYMEWLDSWVNLDRMALTEDFSKHWKELLEATGEEILPYLNK